MSTNQQLETGTYEIIRNRLDQQSADLRNRLQNLNQARRQVFGNIETTLIASDRIHTEHYCTARDIEAIGQHCIFGYNVHIGLRKGINLQDVFSIYEFKDHGFHQTGMGLIDDEKFRTDFKNLYRYYKSAIFSRFVRLDTYLYMVFQVSDKSEDIKAFKWLILDDDLKYIDARSEQEVRFPEQFEFRWVEAGRDMQRNGRHPHVSILDRCFVETVGGDLTIKVEDNTGSGMGIYSETVEFEDQTLDDGEFHFADLGNLIALKIKPYQEAARFFIFNDKNQEVTRVNALEDSGVLLPEDQGLIFANGYYLQTGENKIFEAPIQKKKFERRITSSNGEDFLYVFYNVEKGTYVLLHYNLITREVSTPILCNGYTLFPDGELCYFKAEAEAVKHHTIQIWQTPFTKGEQSLAGKNGNFLFKVGNKDIVRAMADVHELLSLCQKQDSYLGLYDDITSKAGEVLDAYYWLGNEEAFQLDQSLLQVREIANTAIEEFEKKNKVQTNTAESIGESKELTEKLIREIQLTSFSDITQYVSFLADLRTMRARIIGLRTLRYADAEIIDTMEEEIRVQNEKLSESCVEFLLQEEALTPYKKEVSILEDGIKKIETVAQADELLEGIDQLSGNLEMLIDIVGNLKISDATQTTKIIDSISALFADINHFRVAVRQKRKGLMRTESSAEFNAQLQLLEQGIINYLDLADSEEKCDEYLSKLMVQLEELESKFAEFDAFVTILSEKRETVFNAFEGRKKSIVEKKSKRIAALENAGERILVAVGNRVAGFRQMEEINGFFASDLMIDKVRDLIRQLHEMDSSGKADALQNKLNAAREDAVRQLRDKQDLFVEGENVIKLGQHHFNVNVQPLELTTVIKDKVLNFHLTGTDFYQTIESEILETSASVWNQELVSENQNIYRSEYLAWQLFTKGKNRPEEEEALTNWVKQQASSKFEEGYTKGVHDEDGRVILEHLILLEREMGLLTFNPGTRALARFFWEELCLDPKKITIEKQLKNAGQVLSVFPDSTAFDELKNDLSVLLTMVSAEHDFPVEVSTEQMAEYLFRELCCQDDYVKSQAAVDLTKRFETYLKQQRVKSRFSEAIKSLDGNPEQKFLAIRQWGQSFLDQEQLDDMMFYLDEITALLYFGQKAEERVVDVASRFEIKNLRGEHGLIQDGSYDFDFHRFVDKMRNYEDSVVPLFRSFQENKRKVSDGFRKELRLEEFKPQVLSTFVRNQLIDRIYLPLFGDNLAKQMGTAGESSRTDRMGMLLLISPPGYGKTTLMEYVADRLGLAFMKINGPSIGHHVTSLDPDAARDRASKQELQKLNLAFEMGDNVMIYLDDIQHCNPELLQKFISLCDAQRKVEGVWRGQSKTYDLRGKRVCVVMAGNPYTESGEQFQVPDMLANRSDVYNLGDMAGNAEDVFRLSYLENAVTSSAFLQEIARKSTRDMETLIRLAETGDESGVEFESDHSAEALDDALKVLKKMLEVRDVVLAVNREYIRSAMITEAYREEPAFKLQGSYRNMNKLTEKLSPLMNEEELKELILSHYVSEGQTLSSDGEANLLKFKMMLGWQSKEEADRWHNILETFNKGKMLHGTGEQNPLAPLVLEMQFFNNHLKEIKDKISLNGK
ncbi:MAG: AAA family ATPase [Bacteroidetes bacterium]|nr:MAG: AAA family ATPase [Bacteroidota bacterium]